jgi:endonuclease/exonuclease/phosphatase (EEP) superfamily protein YafD
VNVEKEAIAWFSRPETWVALAGGLVMLGSFWPNFGKWRPAMRVLAIGLWATAGIMRSASLKEEAVAKEKPQVADYQSKGCGWLKRERTVKPFKPAAR